MNVKRSLIVGIAISLIWVVAKTGFCQEKTVQGGAVPETMVEPETQWAWGEVVSVDLAAKALTVKYLDYETDQEKELNITTNEETTYENCKSLEELKSKDAISIDYIITPDGKNLAKNISLEKQEEPAISTNENGNMAPEANPQPAVSSDAAGSGVTTLGK